MATRVKINRAAFHALRSAPGVVAELDSRAEKIAAAANETLPEQDDPKGPPEHYVAGSQQGESKPQGRWRASVVTASAQAMASNAKNNTLLKVLGSG
ncbi:hypothetical protein ACFWQG_13060 [Rhodococcus sp. NPDC058532]|uniref:hypothetical protein n=1 Tax=Rhodococcus sp. NPDC058532 TaxID=3346540 RepID=UPI003667BD1D